MPVIRKLPRAANDLLDIWDYIAEDNVARADAFIDDVEARFRILAEQPLLGRRREELAPGLRSFPLGRYIIFYKVLPDGIEIVRVLHGSRDLGAQNTSQWLAREAIAQYVDREEKRVCFYDDARRSLEQYEETGRYVKGYEALAWLDSWGIEQEKPTPECQSAR